MKLASIEKLHSVRLHPNSDILLIGKILGWQVVFKKGDFNEGDFGVFIYPDVLVDSANPSFSFMEKNHYKVWVAKFRGERSEGLFMPLSLLKDYGDLVSEVGCCPMEGLDVGEFIKCVKYEKPMPTNLDAVGPFPSYIIAITDEDNLKSHPLAYDELLAAGPCYITLKADGSSGTFISQDHRIRVCNRRWELKPGNDAWNRAAEKYGMMKKLSGQNIAMQFEVVGPGMQSNKMNLVALEIRVFNVKNLNTGELFGYEDLQEFCFQNGFPMAQVLHVGELPSFDKLVEMADAVKYGQAHGEGFVIRPVKPVHSEVLGKELSVKIINSNYKD